MKTIIEITDGNKNMFMRHAKYVLNNVRQSDSEEIRSISGISAYDDIIGAIDCTSDGRIWILLEREGSENVPVVLFGVSRYNDTVGTPWMVATDRFSNVKSFFIRNTTRMVVDMMDGYKTLLNYVMTNNEATQHWLRRIGFTMMKPIKMGVRDDEFTPFFMECK